MKRILVCLLFACSFLFTTISFAEEGPRAKPAQRERVDSGDVEKLMKSRSCKPLKNGARETFGDLGFLKAEGGSCSGWCTCSLCYCEYVGDSACCDMGCGYCWGVLDGGGSCNAT